MFVLRKIAVLAIFSLVACKGDSGSEPDTPEPVATNPAFNLVKSSDVNSVSSPSVITYSYVFKNTGDVELSDLTVSDSRIDDGSLSGCSVAKLAVNNEATCTATYTVTQEDIDKGDAITSEATASAKDPDGKTVTESDTSDNASSVSIAQKIELALEVSPAILSNDADNNSLVTPGDTLSYTVTVTNSGNITQTDVLLQTNILTPNSKNCGTITLGQNCALEGTYLVTSQDAFVGEVKLQSNASSSQQTSQIEVNTTTPVSEGVTSDLVRLTDGIDYSACKFKPTNNMPRKNQPDRPIIVKHGWDLPRTSYLTKNDGSAEENFVNQIKGRGFDGVTFTLGKVSHAIGPGTYSESDAETAMAHLDAVDLGDVNENMIMLYTHQLKGGYDKDGYKQVAKNLRHLAKAASKRSNVKGILLDTEFYPSNTYGKIDPWDYSSDICEGYTASRTGRANGFANPQDKKKCDIQAYNRGYEAMQAMVAEWPNLKLLTLFGIWTDDPRTFNLVNGAWGDPNTGFAPHVEWHHSQGVMPHFLAGMFAATICTDATFTDGTELYGLREVSDFEQTGKFITNDIVDNNPYLPDNVKEAYRAEVGLGFGIYDDHFAVFASHAKFPIPKMKPNEWELTIKNAGKVATHYVWLYTERHDWWGEDPNPHPPVKVEAEPAWITATNNAIDEIKKK